MQESEKVISYKAANSEYIHHFIQDTFYGCSFLPLNINANQPLGLLLQDIAVLLWPDELSMPFWLSAMSLHLFSTAWGCVTVILQETVMAHQHPNVNLYDRIKVTKLAVHSLNGIKTDVNMT